MSSFTSEQQQFFERTMDLVARMHPYYSALMAERGLGRADFSRPDDLRKLPLTRKSDYAAAPERFRLQTADRDDLPLPERTLAQVIYTTGSTAGHPTPFYDTNYDHASRIWQLKELGGRLGLTTSDTIVNLFPLTPVFHQGFLTALYAGLVTGAPVVSALTGQPSTPFDVYGDTDRVLHLLREHRTTVLWGIGSYVRRVVVAAAEGGIDLSGTRLIFLGGEPASAELRADLRTRLAACGALEVSVQNGYGFTEMQGPALHCGENGPYHLPTPAQYFVEVVDPDTGEPLPDGAEGTVLISHLNRRGTVLLRYAVGDVSTLEHGRCPICGHDGPRFSSPPRRVGELLKVKGTLINPAVLVQALFQVPNLLDFQVRATYLDDADPLSGDDLVVEITTSDHDETTVVTQVREATRRAVEITPTVRVTPKGVLERIDLSYKPRRFVDERAAALKKDGR